MRLAATGAALAAVALLAVPFAGAQAAQPTCTIVDFTFTETDGGTVSHPWNLACSNPTAVTESATFQTFDATARGPADYIPFGGTISVPQGLSTRPILIDVVGDDVPEPTEVFAIRFEDPEGVIRFEDATGSVEKTSSAITIEDDDGFTVTSVSRSAPEGDSGSSAVDVEVRLNEPVDRPFDVTFYTQDISATAGVDYEETNVTLTFQPGDTSKLAPVTILGDTEDESDETVFLGLGIEGTGTLRSGALTIVDDDGGASGPCIVLSESSVLVHGAVFSTPTRRGIYGSDPHLTVTNCGTFDVNLEARGTDAAGTGATWELTDASSGGAIDSTCELGLDIFRADLTLWNLPGGVPGIGTPLTTEDRTLVGADGTQPFVLAPDAVQELSPDVETPCTGSSGAGQPMTMDVVLTAIATS